METTGIYFSLGSNMGERERNIREAVRLLEDRLGVGAVVSDLVETEPWGFECRDRFLNAVARFDLPGEGFSADVTDLPQAALPVGTSRAAVQAFALLRLCKQIEKALGRQERPLCDRGGRRQYFSRPIDIDILFYGKLQLKSARLTIPHAHIAERDFVMRPLRQVVSKEMAAAFPEIITPEPFPKEAARGQDLFGKH